MNIKAFYRKYENSVLAIVLLAVVGIFAAVRYDYYFALNDDVLIKDIISGVYMGSPASRNNQILYPMSLMFSLIYKVLPAVPWYGLFVWICHFGCLFLIIRRSLAMCSERKSKWLLCAAEGLLIAGFFLEHLIFAQYTITSGLLAGTAIFLFVTEKDRGHLLKKSIPGIVLAIIAFLLRSEMLLLMLPFICVAGVYQWSCETRIFTAKNFKTYFAVFGCILVGLVVSLVVDEIGYSSADWKDFRAYFDARTMLYDYTGIPVYEQNEAFYEEHDILKEQYDLLQNYNYALDEEIDTGLLETVSEYAQGIQDSFFSRLKMGVIRYRYRITNMDGYPYCLLAVLGYVLFAAALTGKNKWRMVFVLAFLLGIRSVVWVYILMTNRIPVRITHPLYFAEFLLLAAICMAELSALKGKGKSIVYREAVAVAFCLLIGGCNVVGGIRTTDEQFAETIENNVANNELQAYCAENPDNFYFLDVYSSIYFTEKVFGGNSQASNYELLGGWICNSPLYDEKLASYGIDSVEEAFKTMDNVYLVQENGTSFEWIEQFYGTKGYQVAVQEIEIFDDWLGVYQLEISER